MSDRVNDFYKDQVEALQRELRGVQEMLAFVLKTVGEPVVVHKEDLSRGLGPDLSISIEDNIMLDAFVFRLVKETNDDD